MNSFISHTSTESRLALKLKDAINKDFLGFIRIYVSSDGESIAAGEDWLKSINETLKNAKFLIVLCSPISIHQPWINFELGAAWIRDVPIIPLCHSELTPQDLPMPLSLKHGLLLDEANHLRQLYSRIATIMSCQLPDRSFDDLAKDLSKITNSFKHKGNEGNSPELNANRTIRKKLKEVLKSHKLKWRTLERLAIEAAVSVDTVADLLRADESVRFSKSKTGKPIVGLISRVGKKY